MENPSDKKRGTIAWISGIISAIASMVAAGYAAFLYSLHLDVERLGAAGRLNEGDKEGCMAGCGYVIAVPIGWAIGGGSLALFLVALGLVVYGKKPWLILFSIPGLVYVIWVLVANDMMPGSFLK